MTNFFNRKSSNKSLSHVPTHSSNFRTDISQRVQVLEIKIEISILFDHITSNTIRETRKILFFLTMILEFEAKLHMRSSHGIHK